MASYTPEAVRAVLEKLPDQYTDLAACFMTVVHDLVAGNADRYQERVSQLADGYFVFILESFRSPYDCVIGTPGILRVLMHQSSSEISSLGAIPHIYHLVEAVFEQFEDRLWSLLVDAFSDVVALPERGPCDLLVPVFGMLIKDVVRDVSFDDVPTLKSSTRHTLATIPVSDVNRVIIHFIEQMTSMLSGQSVQASHRVRDQLIAFILSFKTNVPSAEQERLSMFLNRLSDGSVTLLAKRGSMVLN